MSEVDIRPAPAPASCDNSTSCADGWEIGDVESDYSGSYAELIVSSIVFTRCVLLS